MEQREAKPRFQTSRDCQTAQLAGTRGNSIRHGDDRRVRVGGPQRFSGNSWITRVVILLIAAGTAGSAGAAPRTSSRAVRPSDIPQVQFINQQMEAVWSDYGLKPSPKATDGEWCRRVFLDVLGRIPTVEEVRRFTVSRDPRKKVKLVSRLLYDEEYADEYVRNWTTIWTNVLIGRTGGTERNSLTNREGLQQYLRESLSTNKPYNDMVRELITATGSNTPDKGNFNGAVNFLIDKVNNERATLATASTARIFLGLQVQCTQCHNHPFNEWKQQKFWELNAFFRQTRAVTRRVPGTRDTDYVDLVDQDFAGEDRGGDPADAAVYYELRNGLVRVAYPVFVDGTPIGHSGRVADLRRRDELAKLVLRSPFLDKMLVNRYWAHFLGYGFTKPIDDLGPHNPPSHPLLLDYLAHEVRNHSYDLKELIRWITLSEPYGLSSRRTKWNESDDPALGDPPKFSHFYLRQMRAEELYESLLVATQAHRTRGNYEEQERAKSRWLSQFVTAFGNDEGEEATTFNGTIPQALVMFNGELIRNATSAQQGSFLWNVLRSELPPSEKIEYLYLAGLARKPTRDEIALANQLLAARVHGASDDQRGAGDPLVSTLQDLWWSILNSNEFILNH